MSMKIRWAALFIIIGFFALPLQAEQYVVDNGTATDDGNPYTAGDGTNTLTKCVRVANNNPGRDTITFNVTNVNIGNGPALPAITDPVKIDGGTSAGDIPRVRVTGGADWHDAFYIDGGAGGNNVTINGLSIGACGGGTNAGININNSSGNVIYDCHLLVNNTSDDVEGPFQPSVRITGNNAQNNQIGGRGDSSNVFGSKDNAVVIESGASQNEVYGNYFGLNQSGTVFPTQFSTGVYIAGTEDNVVGGTGDRRNFIVNASNDGIFIDGGGTGNVIRNDSIANNGDTGIEIAPGDSNTVENCVIEENSSEGIFLNEARYNEMRDNYIAANGDNGVRINGSSGLQSTGNVVDNNMIGLTKDGAAARVNGPGNTNSHGVYLHEYTTADIVTNNNIVTDGAGSGINVISEGGDSLAGNLIGTDEAGTSGLGIGSGDGQHCIDVNGAPDLKVINNTAVTATDHGIRFIGGSHNALIQGNNIGVDKNGTAPDNQEFRNNGTGLYIQGSDNMTIGGTGSGEGNIICNNGEDPTGSNSVNGAGVIVYQCDGHTIQGNYIGVDASGTTGFGNDHNGIMAQEANDILIGGSSKGARNVIGDNGYNTDAGLRHGIQLNGFAGSNDNVTIKGNFIGVGSDGTTPLGNAQDGVSLGGGGLTNVTVGGTSYMERNVVSDNTTGINVYAGTDSVDVIGNYAGTDSSGTAAVGNSYAGIAISEGNNNLVESNVASGNSGAGVRLETSTTGTQSGNELYDNYVGLDYTGTATIANDTGMVVRGSVDDQVGGGGANEANYIAGNTTKGVYMDRATGTTFQGNNVGADVNNNDKGNGQQGFYLENGTNSNIIGGLSSGLGNRIAFNGDEGVFITGGSSNNNSIRRNSIYCNGTANTTKGINLNGSGNDNYSKPSFTSLNADSSQISGTAPANSEVEVFQIAYCDDCDDPTNEVQGWIYLGTTTADGSGDFTYDHGSKLPGPVTATASESNTLPNNTSEFSNCFDLPLPVQMLSFEASVVGEQSVKLTWATGSEKNNSHFLVQRSKDGKNFETIGRVNGAGTISGVQEYTFTDELVNADIAYYRIKQVDFDGNSSSSSIRSVAFKEQHVVISPNPGDGLFKVHISGESGEPVDVKVFTALGQKVYAKTFESGKSGLSIDLRNESQGLYMMKISLPENEITRKIIIRQ